MTESFENSHWMLVFDNFFNSPSFIVKFYENTYGIDAARKDKKGCQRCKINWKKGDFEYLYSDKVACCKRLGRRSVTMLFSNAEGIATTSTVLSAKRMSVKNSSTLSRSYTSITYT